MTSSSPSPALTRLVTLRGNSASGKTSVAAGLRQAYGRGIALVGQDMIRRQILRERDIPGGANIGLLDLTVRHCLDSGFHAVLEGILYLDHYGAMLEQLLADYAGRTSCFYLDIPLTETFTRHATKPIAGEVTHDMLTEWYRPRDLLPGGVETVIPASSSLPGTIDTVMRASGLWDLARR